MATTATRWLTDNPGDEAALGEVLESSGMPFKVYTELPKAMRKTIARQLETSFKQQYWKAIQRESASYVSGLLQQGLRTGVGIAAMARQIQHQLIDTVGRRALVRARAIARTESANALNGARKAGMDQLALDVGEDIPMVPVWLSVLGNTTRDTHAELDGVEADENGEWNLAGTMVPWPGHYSLPPEERINCQCTIIQTFGEKAKGILTSGDFLEDALGTVRLATIEIKRNVSRTLFARHIALTGRDLAEIIAPVIEESIQDAAQRLEDIAPPEKSVEGAADSLVQLAFDKDKWTDELIDRSLPVMAIRMAEAAKIQLAEMKRDSPEAVARLRTN